MNDPFFMPQKKKRAPQQPRSDKRGFRGGASASAGDDDDMPRYSARKTPRFEKDAYSARSTADDSDSESESVSNNGK